MCLDAARRAGLTTPRSWIARFGDETAIVVERYDRVKVGRTVERVHQEDLCQAMGLHPNSKYENDGGPSAASIAKLLRRTMSPRHAEDAVWGFVDALAWNWIIAGTDAHAKNYSLLLNRREVRFAPLYDVSSILPYLGERGPDGEVIHGRSVRMAMKIGGEYQLEPPRNTWRAAASELGLPPDALLERVRTLATSAPSAFAAAAADPSISSFQTDFIARLVEMVAVRASRCADVLA